MVLSRTRTARRRRWLRLLATLLALIAPACAPFHPVELPDVAIADSRPHTESGPTDIGTGNLSKKMVVRADGTFVGRRLIARSLTIEADDSDIQLKGLLVSTSQNKDSITVGPLTFSVKESSKLIDEEGRVIAFTDLRPGDWTKVEAAHDKLGLLVRKLTVRTRKAGELDSIKGRIDDIVRSKGQILIGSTEVTFRPDTPVAWRKSDPAPVPIKQDRVINRSNSVLRQSIHKLSDEDMRPDNPLKLGDSLSFSGELKHELELRENFDLQLDRRRDRLIGTQLVSLEATFDLNRHFMSYTKIEALWDYVWMDQDANLKGGNITAMREGWVLLEDLPIDGFGLQAGRIDFDHGREWLMDDQYDAVRAFVNLDGAILEASYGRKMWDPTPNEDEIENTLLAARIDSIPRTDLLAYYLHREGGKGSRVNRNHFGVSAEVDYGPGKIWSELSKAYGDEDGHPFSGVGGDLTIMHVVSQKGVAPSFYAGYAFGTGDYDPFTATDRGFRQSGLNDNQDKFNGVASFNYYGEIMAPDLTNLQVVTFGFGIRPSPKSSIDVVFHDYRQWEVSHLAPFGTRLRQSVNGQSPDLGRELDLIIGFEESAHWLLELNVGVFMPGDAFVHTDTAYFAYLKLAYRF